MYGGETKIKTLLSVNLYEISTKFIYDLRNAHPDSERLFKFLPKYTINTNKNANNRIIYAQDFHQFVGFSENEENIKYLYFNFEAIDECLKEEIDNAGIENLFKDLDIKNILSNFTPENEKCLTNFSISRRKYLIVEITYDVTYDHIGGGSECDTYVDIVGYLDDNMNVKYFNN